MDIIKQDLHIKIRKSHNCWGCTKSFSPPTEMGKVVCADNGKIYSVFWCKSCQEKLNNIPFGDGQESWEYGELSQLGEPEMRLE